MISYIASHALIAALFVAGAIGVALSGWITAVTNKILPDPGNVVCVAGDFCKAWWRRLWRLVGQRQFVILIATLYGDENTETNTRFVERAFAGNKSVERYRTCRTLRLGPGQLDELKS